MVVLYKLFFIYELINGNTVDERNTQVVLTSLVLV